MSENNTVRTRAQQKRDFETNWIKAGNNGFIPLDGEFIIYKAEIPTEQITKEFLLIGTNRSSLIPYTRIKLGDGKTNINDLEFQVSEGDLQAKLDANDWVSTETGWKKEGYNPWYETNYTAAALNEWGLTFKDSADNSVRMAADKITFTAPEAEDFTFGDPSKYLAVEFNTNGINVTTRAYNNESCDAVPSENFNYEYPTQSGTLATTSDIAGEISKLRGTASYGATIRDIAREEAYKVETSAMEYMGIISHLPINLKESDKGHFYKAAQDIITDNSVFAENQTQVKHLESFYWEDISELPSELVYEFSTNIRINGEFAGRLTPKLGCLYPITEIKIIGTLYQYDADSSSGYTEQAIEEVLVDGYYTVLPLYIDDYLKISKIIVTIATDKIIPDFIDDPDNSRSFLDVACTLDCVIQSVTNPADISTIKKNDSVIWDGYIWNIIPSGDDPYREVLIDGVTIGNAALNLKAGTNITLTRNNGTVTINATSETIDLSALKGEVKTELQEELKAYVDDTILNGEW